MDDVDCWFLCRDSSDRIQDRNFSLHALPLLLVLNDNIHASVSRISYMY